MTGKLEKVIDASEFVKGISSGGDISDGGFRPNVGSFNLTYNVGVINGVPDLVDKSANMSGEAIGHCVSDGTGAYPNGFILTNNGTVLGVDAAQALTASTPLTGTYQVGTSDITNFFPSGDASKLYITSTNDIARMNIDLSAGDSTWWSVTLGKGTLNTSVRHPVLQYLGYVFVGNGNTLARVESSTSGTAAFLTLPTQYQIVALGIDPGTGRMLISTTQGGNYSGTVGTTNKVFIYDGTGPVPIEVPVDGMITAFRSSGGTTFLGVGRRFGYWNGSGISYLRTLQHATNTAADLIYKHHITNIGNTVYIIDGTRVLAYGEVLRGRKVFYYAANNTLNSNNLSLVTNIGDEKLGLGFATSKFYTFDTIGTGSGTFNTLGTNRLSFPRPVYIRQVYIEYADTGVANLDHNRTLYYLSGEAPTTPIAMSSIDNDSGGVIWENREVIGVASNPVRTIRFSFAASSCPGIKRMIIYYDVTE